MKRITLENGGHALIDDEDYAALGGHRWMRIRVRHTEYAYRYLNGRTIYMHREIAAPGHGEQVDHKNLDGLDNRRSNLRLCDRSGNAANSRRGAPASGYRGVYAQATGGYRVRVWGRGKQYGGGRAFATAEEAARARDEIAAAIHGDFAKLNFPAGSVR